MKRESQNQQVLKHLIKDGKIDALTAFRMYGIMRLGARIFNLKKTVEIESKIVPNKGGGYHAEYSMTPTWRAVEKNWGNRQANEKGF